MLKLSLRLGLAVVVLASATPSDAGIFVTISDGTSTVTGTASIPGKGNFTLYKASPAPTGTLDVTDTLTLLTCTARPCTVFFPSGQAIQQGSDTFKFQDVSSTALARVEKFDSQASADRVSLRGIKITSLAAGRTLTVTYGVQSGDLRTLTTGSYPATAALSGTFRTNGGTGLTRATACTAGLTSTDVATPCAKLTVKINGTTLNNQGATAIATAAVPCNNSFPTVNPCGTNGSWSSTGSFSGVNDSNSISCPNPCVPVQVGTLVAKFAGSNEALQLPTSASTGFANVSDQNGGLEEIFLTLADELGANRWLPYTAASERCRAVPTGTTDGSTRNINNQSTIPLSFELECGFFAPLAPGTGVDLLSIVDPLEVTKLIGSASTRNDASRVGFLPGQGQLTLKGINVLTFTYDVFVSPPNGPSGNSTLGDVTYTDCIAGSLRVEFQLLDNKTGAPVGTAKVYLGHEPSDHFRSGCDGFESIGTDLVNNPDERVDTSGLIGNLASPCCITFKHLQQGQTGPLIVRKLSLIVDHGNDPSMFANHKATFFDGNVNGVTASSSLQIVTGFQQITDLPTNGVSMVIRKLTLNQARVLNPPVVKVLLDPEIQINGGEYRSHVDVNDLIPDIGGTQYSIDLCLFGAVEVDPSVTATTPRGTCIPGQAIMTLL
jgi:hypothetical protein